jgi:hypothetical protein
MLKAVFLVGLLLSYVATNAVAAGTTKEEAFQPRSAAQSYANARMILGASRAGTDAEVDKRLASIGFSRTGTNWTFSDDEGRVTVFGVAGSFHQVIFTPSRRVPMPDALAASLSSKADEAKLLGPDELYYVFHDEPPVPQAKGGASNYDQWVFVSLADGAWLRTTAWVVYK